MEFPDLGQHCSNSSCKQLDFLPVKCHACNQIFCKDHFPYDKHGCPEAYKRDNQVPVCPLCNTPVSVRKGDMVDVVVGRHIDNDCQSDTAKSKRKIYTNRCALKGCKQKELIPFKCEKCHQNFCVRHRLEADHDCQGGLSTAGLAALSRFNQSQAASSSSKASASTSAKPAAKSQPSKPQQSMLSFIGQGLDRERQERTQQGQRRTNVNDVQAGMTEDEAMAKALSLSMQTTTFEPSSGEKTLVQEEQERQDAELARQLQAEEQQRTSRNHAAAQNASQSEQSRQKDKSCSVS